VATLSPENVLEIKLPSDPASIGQARHAAASLARKVGAAEDDVKLAVSEAVGNAVVHAFRGDHEDGTITLSARGERGMLLLMVSDDGIGMTPNLDSPGLGFGLSLISKVAEDVRFDSSDSGTTVSMSFPAQATEAA
jgi:anti-sigma regulatory factor (Ser/Thr protein kinase)